MSQPFLGDELFNLPPKIKVVLGAISTLVGALACDWLWERGWILGGAILTFVLGLLLLWSGRQELLRQRAIDAEVEQARREWSELERGVASTKRDGKSVARYLQTKGYREYAVRRWIASELDGEDETG